MIFQDSHIIAMKGLDLSTDNVVNLQIIPQEAFYHDLGHIAYRNTCLGFLDHLKHLEAHVLKKELGENGCSEPEAIFSEAKERDHDHDAQPQFLILLPGQTNERVREKEEKSPEDASSFKGDQHEIREERGGLEQRGFHIKD